MATDTTVREQRRRDTPEADAGMSPQSDTWRQFVDGLAQQFGDAIDPVLAELPKRMARAIEAQLPETEKRVAQIMPAETDESSDSGVEADTQPPQSDASERGSNENQDGDSPSNDERGGRDMARASTKTEEREDQDRNRSNGSDREKGNSRTVARGDGSQSGSDNGRRRTDQRSGSGRPTYAFDPAAAARAGLVRFAERSREDGATYQAIHAYTEILLRYPSSGAADAATEGLLDLAESLEREGKYYTALGIFDKLYQLA